MYVQNRRLSNSSHVVLLLAVGLGSLRRSEVIDDWEAGRTTVLATGKGEAIHSHLAPGLVRPSPATQRPCFDGIGPCILVFCPCGCVAWFTVCSLCFLETSG